MPNWCMNKLTISHSDKSMIDRFVQAFNEDRTCKEFIPEPEGLNRADCFADDGWYTWRNNNWGTKWDFGADGNYAEQRGDMAVCSFDTAWSPPIGLYDKLSKLGFEIKAMYLEPGMGYCGEFEDGQDYELEYHKKKHIPIGIYNAFGCMYWEEDPD